jgi:SAM-dependent methyltransferase
MHIKPIPVLGGMLLIALLTFAWITPWSALRAHHCETATDPSFGNNQQQLLKHVDEYDKPTIINEIEESDDASSSYYNEKYWAWQKNMNEFGGTFKGEVIMASMKGSSGISATVLEFGSSGGFIIDFIRKNVRNSTAIGVEINAAAREHSRRHFPNVKVVARTASIPASSVEFVYTTSVLEHVDCPVCELREFRRILKPKGEILVMVVSEGVSRKQDAYAPNDVNNHLHTWTALQMGNTINAAGLHVCGCITEWSAWAHISIPSYLASRRQTCKDFLAKGRELSALNIRCMAVLPDNKGQCGDVKARLHRTLECRYLD